MIDLILDYSLVIFLFFLISILYSSVGFGGGSSYLAVLTLTVLAFTQIRTTALLCNLVVVSGNVFYYQKEKQLNFKKIYPLVILSIPFAYLGGILRINAQLFYFLLSILLIITAITMWISKNKKTIDFSKKKYITLKNSFLGGIIGFFSGLVGIGGGILLAPILHLTNWGTSKKIAAAASFFILVNSVAGLLGQISNANFKLNWQLTSILIATVFVGGKIGRSIGNRYLSALQLKKATALLIACIGIKILLETSFN
ncbi:MAG: sulfite exporter TauE/SafE family protein [Polaribacter sp.]|jgi:uncharacterized protein